MLLDKYANLTVNTPQINTLIDKIRNCTQTIKVYWLWLACHLAYKVFEADHVGALFFDRKRPESDGETKKECFFALKVVRIYESQKLTRLYLQTLITHDQGNMITKQERVKLENVEVEDSFSRQ